MTFFLYCKAEGGKGNQYYPSSFKQTRIFINNLLIFSLKRLYCHLIFIGPRDRPARAHPNYLHKNYVLPRVKTKGCQNIQLFPNDFYKYVNTQTAFYPHNAPHSALFKQVLKLICSSARHIDTCSSVSLSSIKNKFQYENSLTSS